MPTQLLSKNLIGRHVWEESGTDGGKIMKWLLNKWGWEVWTGQMSWWWSLWECSPEPSFTKQREGVPRLSDYNHWNDSAHSYVTTWQHFYCGLKCSFVRSRQIIKLVVWTYTHEEVEFYVIVCIWQSWWILHSLIQFTFRDATVWLPGSMVWQYA
jgi:hypothetical protein